MVVRKISGYGEVLSLRPWGPPLPLWRERHLPRIGGVCLAEGGKRGGASGTPPPTLLGGGCGNFRLFDFWDAGQIPCVDDL